MMSFKEFFLRNISDKQTIIKNSLWLGIAEIITKGLGFVISILMARHYGPTIYGHWSFAMNFVTCFIFLADFGFEGLIIREISQNRKKGQKLANNMLIIKCLLGLISIIVINLTIKLLHKNIEIELIVLNLSFYIVLRTFTAFINSIFRAYEKMQYETFNRIIQLLILFILTLILIQKKSPISHIANAYTVANLCSFLIGLIFIKNKTSLTKNYLQNINIKKWSNIFYKSWPFALTTLLAFFYKSMNPIILGQLSKIQEVGWYNVAFNLALNLTIPVILISQSFYPQLSLNYYINFPKCQKIWHFQFSLMIIISLPLIIGGILTSSKIINIIYGIEYQPSIKAFQILITAIGIIYLSDPFEKILTVSNNYQKVFQSTMIGTIANFFLNLILIPQIGLYGSALSLLFSQVIILGLLICWTKRKTNLIIFNEYIKKIIMTSLISSLGMGLIIVFCQRILFSNIIVIISLGLIIYTLLITKMNNLRFKDLRLLLNCQEKE